MVTEVLFLASPIGQEVALFAKKNLKEYIKGSPSFAKGDYGNALKDAFCKVDEVLKTAEGRKELYELSSSAAKSPSLRLDGEELARNTGCTACAALITKNEIYVANAGDSRGVLCRKGLAIAMSEDHKPESDKERKRIEASGGSVLDGRVNGVLNLSRSLGDLEFKMAKKFSPAEQAITPIPDIRVEKLTEDTEFFILACDGIWDCLTNEKAVSLIREKLWHTATNKPVKAKLAKVVSDILDSIIAVDLDNPGNFQD